MGWAGFNCSIPHKVAVIEHLDGLAESAAVIGAVNCVVRRDGRYVGENTDGQGFLDARCAPSSILPASRSSSSVRAAPHARSRSRPRLPERPRSRSSTAIRERGSDLVALLEERTQARADLVTWERTYPRP